ncbi:MAG: ABC transporter permease, partial [Sediminibacterium sp.]|nr:ABC transporter permease [Sediminibacterium sp.]
WLSLFVGLAFSMMLAFIIGAGIPVLLFQPDITGFTMILIGLLLSVIFVSIALLATVKTRDKAKGIGVAILLWLYFSLLFDGLILFLVFQLSDYPIEKAMVGVSMLNPIDLGRILILLKMDVSALMGYTGAVFNHFFGTVIGMGLSFLVLLFWLMIPLWLSIKNFNHKDL